MGKEIIIITIRKASLLEKIFNWLGYSLMFEEKWFFLISANNIKVWA
jgi:hypothetical protein